MKILMVCMGNICRSPLAEGVLRNKAEQAGLNWTVESAGTLAYNQGCAPHPLVQRIAKENGVDIGRHECRRLSKEDFKNYDRIYIMDDVNYEDARQIAGDQWYEGKVDYLMNGLYPGENRPVPDPWGGTEEEFCHAYKLIDAACERLVSKAIAHS